MLLAGLSTTALSAQRDPVKSSDPVLTLHTGTHLVVLDVAVIDKKGHTVPGLAPEDFHIAEDGHPQTVKFFEEHRPLDSDAIARKRAALAAGLPPNTFTNYEPFTGHAATILLLNELTPMPPYDIAPIFERMSAVIRTAPPETPFIVYELDTRLRLIQPLTTRRDLLLEAVNQLAQKQHFAAEINLSDQTVLARRKVLTTAIEQLRDSLEPVAGRKTLVAFTGGLRCSLSNLSNCSDGYNAGLVDYLCSVMDIAEQARISIYREYPSAQLIYGFGCRDAPGDLHNIFDTGANYYTLYYTPTNENWNGQYRRVQAIVADKGLRLSYREGYYGRPENAAAHRDAAAAPLPYVASAPDAPANPTPVTFTVQVIPADAPGTGPQATPPSPGNRESEKLRLKGYRDYTLHFTVAASALRVARELNATQSPEIPHYAARMEIVAVSYVAGHPADAKSTQTTATFDGPADPRLASASLTATLTIQVPEHGNRLLHLTVRDILTVQFGRLDIPLDKVVLPAK